MSFHDVHRCSRGPPVSPGRMEKRSCTMNALVGGSTWRNVSTSAAQPSRTSASSARVARMVRRNRDRFCTECDRSTDSRLACRAGNHCGCGGWKTYHGPEKTVPPDGQGHREFEHEPRRADPEGSLSAVERTPRAEVYGDGRGRVAAIQGRVSHREQLTGKRPRGWSSRHRESLHPRPCRRNVASSGSRTGSWGRILDPGPDEDGSAHEELDTITGLVSDGVALKSSSPGARNGVRNSSMAPSTGTGRENR